MGEERDYALFTRNWTNVERRAALNAEVEAIEAHRLAQQAAMQVPGTELKELNQEIKVLNEKHEAQNAEIHASKQEGQAVAHEVWLVLSLNMCSSISAPLRVDRSNGRSNIINDI